MDNTSTGGQPDTQGGVEPGDTITPGGAPIVLPTPVAPVSPAATLAPAPAVIAPAPSPPAAPAQPQPVPTPAVAATPAFSPEPTLVPPQPATTPADDGAIRWVAAEFIAHHKSAAWYAKLALAIIGLAVVVFLLTKDKISTTVVLVAGIALGAYGARQPQQRQYTLDGEGLSIGDKYLPFSLFRSFAVIDEGQVPSISFFPLKRFGQLTTIYYDPEIEEAIVDLLADRLPMDDRGHDALDRFMHRIHF